jgi:hypothetical protein
MPTIGYTSVGATNGVGAGSACSCNIFAAALYTAVSGDVINKLWFYGNSSVAGTLPAAIYDVSGGVPVNRLAAQANIQLAVAPSAWHSLNVSQALVASTVYASAFIVINTTTTYWDVVGGNQHSRAFSATMPNPWVHTSYNTSRYSMYASTVASHDATGVLAGDGAVVAGSAARSNIHPSSGALVGQGAEVAGSAARSSQYAASGVLTGGGGAVAGSAARVASHAATAALEGQGATLSGAAVLNKTHAATGALQGDGGEIVGIAAKSPRYYSMRFNDMAVRDVMACGANIDAMIASQANVDPLFSFSADVEPN